jgi:hypothetical protein
VTIAGLNGWSFKTENRTCRKAAFTDISAYELLINFELQLWDHHLLQKHQDPLQMVSLIRLAVNMQVCKPVVATCTVAAWISYEGLLGRPLSWAFHTVPVLNLVSSTGLAIQIS